MLYFADMHIHQPDSYKSSVTEIRHRELEYRADTAHEKGRGGKETRSVLSDNNPIETGEESDRKHRKRERKGTWQEKEKIFTEGKTDAGKADTLQTDQRTEKQYTVPSTQKPIPRPNRNCRKQKKQVKKK